MIDNSPIGSRSMTKQEQANIIGWIIQLESILPALKKQTIDKTITRQMKVDFQFITHNIIEHMVGNDQ